MNNQAVSDPGSADLRNSREVFAGIRRLVDGEAAAVDRLILRELHSDVVLINQIGQYIVGSGGKRLRPMLHLLSAKALDYPGDHHITLAAVIEFIHTATLLHDDVVDESALRRGQDSANALWGNSASVLVGDYLYSRSFELMVRVQNLRVMDILSRTTTAIAEGEVLQLLNCNNPATDEARYLDVISRKTAILFSAAAQLAAVLAGSSHEVEESLKNYGTYLGIAFQLKDDVLDYKADPEEWGKNLGDDLAEGKPTLPLIYALSQSAGADADLLRQAIEQGEREHFKKVYAVIESTDAISYTERRARDAANKAIEHVTHLPEGDYKDALIALARFAVDRGY
ncbi:MULTISPECIES: polyprenyl synthetase family protein [Methylococcus]|uniref:Polyprenyl synthetase family protein n=1 Tax=Methylococcus capsulatus TaxID=414 RepID=A0ABZ2F6M4_METCP|nr:MULTISPECIES: polyprenyl synthetase family protein [Methylococcus]MDF9393003.1 octaprenyl diphosphate synthase [Methylococcus capsulatus]